MGDEQVRMLNNNPWGRVERGEANRCVVCTVPRTSERYCLVSSSQKSGIISFIYKVRKLGPRDLISLTKFILLTGGRSMLSCHVCLTPNPMIISVPETPFEWEAKKWERSPPLQEAIRMTCGLMGQGGMHVGAR